MMNASEYAAVEAVTDVVDGPVKLFVGQVPRSMDEDELRPVLETFGALEDLVIIRDKLTGAHRGCAFASFVSPDAASRAVDELHNKVVLPQSLNPLQVRPAEGQAGAAQEHKLFIGMIPKAADELAIRRVFAPFGAIEEVYILRHVATGQSKGCAFLKFHDRSAALAAIEQLHGLVTMDRGTAPLVVKFADSRRQRLQRARNLAAATAYWPLPPAAGLAFPPQLTQQLQQQYMQQMQVFGSQVAAGVSPAAAAAAEAVGAGASPSNSFMYYNPYTGFAAGAAPSLYGYNGGGPGNGHGMAGNGGATTFEMERSGGGVGVDAAGQASRASSQLEGPAGANLFIYHLPHDLTDADLATAFAPFGTVISAKVYMDKITGESKGFGFVSYDSADAADAAIVSMNGFQIGTKRLKVQHKRIHQRSDFMGGDGFSGQDDDLASLEYHHQTQQQQMYELEDDGDESGATSSNGAAESHEGGDAALDDAVQQLRIDA